MYYIKSPIGRLLNPDDTFNYQSDDVLKVLYDSHYNPFNDETTPTSLRLLSNAISLDEKRTSDLCEYLNKSNLIDLVRVGVNKYYKINALGIRYVESGGGVL